MRRREFTAGLGGAAVTWPRASQAQQPASPVVGFIHGGEADAFTHLAVAFRKGLSETGYAKGQNVTVKYHWPSSALRLAVIAACVTPAAIAANAASDDSVRLGLVASLVRPGGNATGINIFTSEVVAKRLGLLHEMPRTIRIAVLVDPVNGSHRGIP